MQDGNYRQCSGYFECDRDLTPKVTDNNPSNTNVGASTGSKRKKQRKPIIPAKAYVKSSVLPDLRNVPWGETHTVEVPQHDALSAPSVWEAPVPRPKLRTQKDILNDAHLPLIVNSSIGPKDFVVRRTVFVCKNRNHKLQDITAAVSIVMPGVEVAEARIPAGYCPKCEMYFILESTYERLLHRGTPMCRVSDEKTYLRASSSANDMQLASESLLMQYGYNVSQVQGLTTVQRQKILSLIMDHGIMTKEEILSYLDFFISQRRNRPQYNIAISKWEQDRQFVSRYGTGFGKTVQVRSIRRK